MNIDNKHEEREIIKAAKKQNKRLHSYSSNFFVASNLDIFQIDVMICP